MSWQKRNELQRTVSDMQLDDSVHEALQVGEVLGAVTQHQRLQHAVTDAKTCNDDNTRLLTLKHATATTHG